MESVQFTTTDGATLTGELAAPSDGASPRGGVVLCHPHPLYGGNRHHPMITALHRALPAAAFVSLRFDFRAEHGHGTAEQLDVIAALDVVAEHTEAPLLVVGYSFGAVVALNTDDQRISRLAVIAPPLSAMPTSTPALPTLVLTPRHDQFTPPAAAEPIVTAWPHATFEVVESADHFLAGATGRIAERITAWLIAD